MLSGVIPGSPEWNPALWAQSGASPRGWFSFWAQPQQQRGRRIPVPLSGMLRASTLLIKAGFDFSPRCWAGRSRSPVQLQGLDNSRCAVAVSWLGWSCRTSSGKLRSSSVKSQALLLQAQLGSQRLAHVSNNSLDLPRKMTLDAAKSCQLFPPYAAGQLFSCFPE